MAEDVSLGSKSLSCLFSISNVRILLILVVTSCHGATHWIVTENGRIERQANSYFNLQKPFDLVEFIHQEQRLNQMNVLQDDLKQEKQILQQVQEQEKSDVTETFFKTDSSCKTLKKRLHDMDLNLNHVISFNSKGINVNDHIDVNQRIEENIRLKTPLCQNNPSFALQTFDHLAGIAERHKIHRTLEPGLLSVMPYAADTDVWGHRVASAMEKNSSSWVLQNMAALFWRIKGYTAEAANCLRQALYYSPRKHRDMSLFSLAIILHHANHSMDSIVLLHASLETTSHIPLHHLVLGVIYASIGQFDMSELCFRYVAEIQSDYPPVVDMLEAVICERRYVQALQEQQKTLKEFVSKVKAVNHRQQLMQKLKLLDQQIEDFPLEQFAKQLHSLRKNLVKGSFHPMATDQIQNPVLQQNPNTRPTRHNKETTPCHKQDKVDSCLRNLKSRKVDVKQAKENDEEHSMKKRSLGKKSEAENKTRLHVLENIKRPSCGTSKSSSSDTSSDLSNGSPKDPTSHLSGEDSEGPSSHSSSGISKGPSSGISKGPSSDTSSGISKGPSGHSSSCTSKGSSSHLSSGTSKGSSSHLSSGTSKGSSSHLSRGTSKGPSSHLSSGTSKGPSSHLSSGTSKGPSSDTSSSGTSKGPSSDTSSSGTLKGPSSHSSSGISKGSSSDTSSGISKGSSSHLSSGTSKGPSSDTSSSGTLKGPSSDTSSGISKGPCSHPSSSTSKGPCSHPSSSTSKGLCSDTSSGTSNGNIKSLVQKPSHMKKEQKPSAKLPPKAHKKVQDEKPVKEDSRPHYEQIRACVSAEKGVQSTFNPNNCKESDNMDALMKNEQFSVVTNFESKGIDVTKHVNFNEDISGIPRPPRCLAKIKTGHQSFDHLKGIKALGKMNLPPEYGIKQTLLMHTMSAGMTVEQVGTQINRALKKNSTSWVLLNLASIYWRIMGDTNEAVRCLRLALINSPAKVQDVSLINLASILFKAGFFEDAESISKAVLEISPNAMIAHFTLGNSLAGRGKITEATQHFLMVLQIEPGFMPAVERLKIIQCILWRQQKELEKEAEELRLLLRNT